MKDIISKAKRFLQRNKRRIIHVWQTMWAEKHYYTSLQSYVFECPNKAEILSERTDRLVYAENINNSVVLKQGGLWINRKVIIHNATVFPYSDIVLLEDGRCLYELKEIDGLHKITDYTDEILIKDTNTWCKLKPCKETIHLAKAIKIGGMFGFNYFHYMFQLLPRMLETVDIDASAPILLDKKVMDVKNMQQLAEWCNREKREAIYMDYDCAYEVDELYVITSPNITIPNLKKGYSLYEPKSQFSPNVIDKMSKLLLKYKDTQIKTPKRIYISRRKATKLRGYNEEELVEIAKKFGFNEVFPETMSVAEQIALFNNAEAIVAPEGAALSNLLYIKPSCKVVIMYCMPGLTSEFGGIALLKDAEIFELYDIPNCKLGNSSYQRNYRIEPNKLKDVLEKII